MLVVWLGGEGDGKIVGEWGMGNRKWRTGMSGGVKGEEVRTGMQSNDFMADNVVAWC